MPPDIKEVRRWLEKASHDRAVAELSMTPAVPITDVAAFHCQQAVEKMLKGFLFSRGQAFERTHDLVELLDAYEQLDSAFASLRSQVGGLTPYAVRFRYPGPADPTVKEVQEALEVVEVVW